MRLIKKKLPREQQPFQLYSQGMPNGIRATILRRAVGCRVSEADYDTWLIDIYKGDQFGSGFVDLNPNSKIPALIDYGAVKPVRIFESGAILLYLAEKFGRFIPLML